jgi:hypothetical protein
MEQFSRQKILKEMGKPDSGGEKESGNLPLKTASSTRSKDNKREAGLSVTLCIESLLIRYGR